MRDPDTRWGVVVRAFHWLVAALIMVQAVIGLTMVQLDLSPGKLRVYALHKSLGMTILALVVLRIAWRLTRRRPRDPPTMSRWQRRAARAMHVTLYLLVLALPLSGWWFNSVSNAPLVWFGRVDLPSLTAGYLPAWKPRALALHQGLFWSLAALLAVHVGAALWHHFGQHDDVLRRMLGAPRHRPGRVQCRR